MDENITKEVKMIKAYDLKDLGERLKSVGMPVLEETVEQVVKEVFKWLNDSAAVSATPYDNMLALVYPQIEKLILDKAEQIHKD
jgi:hypothetical protein